MNRINIPNSSYADCPIRMILSRISDKWSILTLFTLTQAPVMRFNEENVDSHPPYIRRRRIGKKTNLCTGSPKSRIFTH